MKNQVYSLPALLRQQMADLEPKVRSLLSTPEIFSIQDILLIGCGDSHAAGLATCYAFEMLADIRTTLISALELSRFYHTSQLGASPNNPLVIAVSNSGDAARVAEAVRRCNLHNAFTLGVTGHAGSALGQAAKRVLQLDIPPFENSSPGIRTYMVSVLALLLLAIRIGEVRGRYTMDEANARRADILRQADLLEAQLPEMDRKARQLASVWKDMEAFEFVGAGFDYATAWFCHAKVLESLGSYATYVDSEEWLHLNFFERNVEKTATVLFANSSNPCHSRNLETAAYMQKLGRPLTIVSDEGEDLFKTQCSYLPSLSSPYPIHIPLTQFAPVCLALGYVQDFCGERTGRGFRGPWEFCRDGAAVRNSVTVY